MTATGRAASRVESDFYPTPPHSVSALLKALPLPLTGAWLEPCAGDGAILRAVAQHYNQSVLPEWTAIELHERSQQLGLIQPNVMWQMPQDFLLWTPPLGGFNVCLTNPPFTLAMPFILKSMAICRITIMLLRLDFLGTQLRHKFHRDNPSDLFVLSKCPFPDSCEYAWFKWPGEGKFCVLPP